MVEATSIKKELRLADFADFKTLKITGKDKDENVELVSGEIESLDSILTPSEFRVVEPRSKLTAEEVTKYQVSHLLEFSVAPNFSGKIYAEDQVTKTKVELRKLPFIEFYVALSCDYPST
jgi:hypothetical protein